MDRTTARHRPVLCRAEHLDERALADPGLVPRPPLALPADGHLGDSERDQLRHVLDPLLEVAS